RAACLTPTSGSSRAWLVVSSCHNHAGLKKYENDVYLRHDKHISEVVMAPLDEAASASRDAGGRFQPGRSGNPRGRPLGSLNRATRLRAWLDDGEERANARIVIDRALGGDHVAARHLMDRLDPKPRTRPL